jgi:tetratricopeptide (TPR) repeat protein
MLFLAGATLLLAFGASGCDKLRARDQLNKGIAAYRDGKYDQAIENFKSAKDLDPDLATARLYLATAYATQYIPGAPSDENIRMGQQAIKEFQDVLSTDANNLTAIDGIGSILFNIASTPPYPRDQFDQSKSYHMKHMTIKPDDPEPYYWVAVIDWTLAYRSDLEMRGKWRLGHAGKVLKDEDAMPPEVRDAYAKENGALIDEGIDDLQKAIQIRPDYDDAMAYLNLLLRRKADEVESADQRAALLKQADDYVDKVKEIKQKKLEEPAKS